MSKLVISISSSDILNQIEHQLDRARKFARSKLIGGVRRDRLETIDELEERLEQLTRAFNVDEANKLLYAAKYAAGA